VQLKNMPLYVLFLRQSEKSKEGAIFSIVFAHVSFRPCHVKNKRRHFIFLCVGWCKKSILSLGQCSGTFGALPRRYHSAIFILMTEDGVMIKTLLASSGVLALVLGSGTASAVTVFTDRGLFEAAVGPLTTETFDNPIATAPTIMFDGGITSTKSSDGIPPTLNRVDSGVFSGFVARDDFRNISFTFPTPIFAFGADFSDLESLFVSGLFDSSSQTLSVSNAIGGSSGFFGLFSSSAFTQILFTTNAGVVLFPGGSPLGGDSFDVDNLSVSSAAISAVPIPGALPLFAAGIGAMGFMGWRKKRKA
jgi:hypothetical protein